MTVREVIELAKNGELKTLAVKEDLQAVLGFINLGMLELYKRFPILQKEYLIEIMYHEVLYEMPEDFMWLITAYQYVKPPQTILNDFDFNVGMNTPVDLIELPINEPDEPLTVNTVGHRSVQIANREVGDIISLIYAAKPRTITEEDLDKEIELPPSMIEALLNYMGYRGHGSVDGKINAESNTHYQRFELSVKRIEGEGMFNTEGLDMRHRIQDKGFV